VGQDGRAGGAGERHTMQQSAGQSARRMRDVLATFKKPTFSDTSCHDMMFNADPAIDHEKQASDAAQPIDALGTHAEQNKQQAELQTRLKR
jgi:hypothetical protein